LHHPVNLDQKRRANLRLSRDERKGYINLVQAASIGDEHPDIRISGFPVEAVVAQYVPVVCREIGSQNGTTQPSVAVDNDDDIKSLLSRKDDWWEG
jgi:hypothetical protein